MRKPRILFVGEASFLSTGYAVYAREVLRRWHASGKYELFELGAYGPYGDPRATELPWPYLTASPNPQNEAENNAYNASPTNQFGEWKFEEACLKHKPDHVVSIRDFWMDSFIERSPFRRLFDWSWMVTCDAYPQSDEWIATYMGCDHVFTYCDWAQEVLDEQGRGQVPIACSTPPGADFEAFFPIPDKAAHKKAMGLDPDALIVGTVMRNQRRKLYPDLLESFASFLKRADPDLARRTFLYMHTGWPDVGWNIPRLIRETGLGHKIILTYACKQCGNIFPSFFQDARGMCPRCKTNSAGFPNTHSGIPNKVLGAIYNLFDVYVQLSNSEGFGIPLVESAACGVPIMAVDYSAMSDVVRKLKGIPIPVQRLHREAETHCYRALPDNEQFVSQLICELQVPEPIRKRRGYAARKAVEEHYNWDQTAKRWMDHFDKTPDRRRVFCNDSIELTDRWNSPAHLLPAAPQPPEGLSDADFVRWGISEVAGRRDLANSYTAMRISRDLSWGMSQAGFGGLCFSDNSTLGTMPRSQAFTRQDAMNAFRSMAERYNHFERLRVAGLSREGA